MRKLNIFLCEDNKLSAKLTKVILTEYLDNKGISYNLVYRTGYQESDLKIFEKFDLAILDIDLKGSALNGIELAHKIQKVNPCIVILFTTEFDYYALEATKIHLCGFLQKPLNPDDFQDALEKSIVAINGFLITKRAAKIAKFGNGKVSLREKDIISVEKIINTKEVNIITTKDVIVAYENIKDIESRLSSYFVKVNRSVIVNLSYIYKIENNEVVMSNDLVYPISVRQEKLVKEAFEAMVAPL